MLRRVIGVISHGRVLWWGMIFILLAAGCTPQASYMRRWQPVERISNRWAGGEIRENKLSADETAVFEELGTPDVIRLFRRAQTRERVYEWIYESNDQVVWFVEGERVDYVVVDTNMLPLTREERQNVQRKAYAGGILSGVVGALATGFILLGEDIGIRN